MISNLNSVSNFKKYRLFKSCKINEKNFGKNFVRRDPREFCLILIRAPLQNFQNILMIKNLIFGPEKIPYFFIRPYDLYKNLLIPGRVFSKQVHIL